MSDIKYNSFKYNFKICNTSVKNTFILLKKLFSDSIYIQNSTRD